MAAITPVNGRVAWLTTYSGVHTYWELNTTNLGTNFGDDSLGGDNTAVAAGDISTSGSYQGMNNQNDPPASDALDIYTVTDAGFLLYLPASWGATNDVVGIFSNGGGTSGQGCQIRKTATGTEIAISHNANNTDQDCMVYEIPDADHDGWHCISLQFSGEGGAQGDMGIWVNGVKVCDGTRGTQLAYGSGNPDFGGSTIDAPLSANGISPYAPATDFAAESSINSTGILIANFWADNPNETNTTPAGLGDTAHSDYYTEHSASAGAYEIAADSGSYSILGTAATLTRHTAIEVALSSNIAPGVTTAQLTAPAGKTSGADFIAGRLEEAANPTTAINPTADKYTEIEFNLRMAAGAPASTKYNLRLTANGTVLDTYTNTIGVTVSAGAELTADAGSYSITGTAAGLEYGRSLTADAGSYSVSGTDATFQLGLSLTADAGSYSISGTAATFLVDYSLTADAGSYSISGVDAGLEYASLLNADAGAYDVTGTDATFQLGYSLVADVGSYTITGVDAGLTVDKTLAADPGAYSISGTDAVLERGKLINALVGTYSISGTAADLEHDSVIDAALGTYTINGTDASLEYGSVTNYEIAADAGTYNVSGTAATFLVDRAIDAGVSTYTINGTDATLTYGSADCNLLLVGDGTSILQVGDGTPLLLTDCSGLTLAAGAGAYSISGTDANLEYNRLLTADAGTYTINGTDAVLERGKILNADSGAYSISGTDASLEAAYLLGADGTSYSISGTDVAFQLGYSFVADSGSYEITGTSATFSVDYVIDADSGSCVINGTNATLTYVPSVIAPDALPAGGLKSKHRDRAREQRELSEQIEWRNRSRGQNDEKEGISPLDAQKSQEVVDKRPAIKVPPKDIDAELRKEFERLKQVSEQKRADELLFMQQQYDDEVMILLLNE